MPLLLSPGHLPRLCRVLPWPACPSICSLSSKAGKCCYPHFLGRGKTCAGSQVPARAITCKEMRSLGPAARPQRGNMPVELSPNNVPKQKAADFHPSHCTAWASSYRTVPLLGPTSSAARTRLPRDPSAPIVEAA